MSEHVPVSESATAETASSSSQTALPQPSSRRVQLRGKGYSDQLSALNPNGQPSYADQAAALVPGASGDVQMRGGDRSAVGVHQAAQAGVAGGGGALPHLDAIQQSFGSHDVSNVEAYTGGAAATSSQAIGAQAYATGNKVAFAQAPDLHTAAHEAAHVVQQRAGVSLKGGVGAEGDRYEQHADAVADAVVQGKSAEGLLDQMAGGSATVGVQREVDTFVGPCTPDYNPPPAAIQKPKPKPKPDPKPKPKPDPKPKPKPKAEKPKEKPKDNKKQPDPEPKTPGMLNQGYFVGWEGSMPPWKKDMKFATVEATVQLGVKGTFTPSDPASPLQAGWQNGIKGEYEWDKFFENKEARGWEVQDFTMVGVATTPFTSEADKKKSREEGNANDHSLFDVAAEFKVTRANGFSHQVNLVLLQVKTDDAGKLTPRAGNVEFLPLSKECKLLNQDIDTDFAKGTVDLTATVTPKLTVAPNWRAIFATKAADAALANVGLGATTAANGGVALNAIGVLELAAIAAPIAFTAATILAVMDLDDAVSRRDNLGTSFRAALASFRGGMRAGLSDGAAGKDKVSARGWSAGKQRRGELYGQFKQAAAGWIAAQEAAGTSQEEIDAELKAAFDTKLNAAADAVVGRATASFDAQLRRESLAKYLNDHSSKPGMCFSFFKTLYPTGTEEPWTVPQDIYEQVRNVCKGIVSMPAWSAKPSTEKTQEQKGAAAKRAKHKGGLSADFIGWCRNYLTHTEAFQASAVEAAYLAEYPDHTVDDNARKSLEHLVGQFIKHPEWRKSREKPEKPMVPTTREKAAASKQVWKARTQAATARNKSARSAEGEEHWKRGEQARSAYVGGDFDASASAMQSYNMAAEAYGVPRANLE